MNNQPLDDQTMAEDPALLKWHLKHLTNDLDRIRAHYDEIKIKVGRNGRMPVRAHRGDAGYDLYTSETTTIDPHTFVDVPTDIYVQPPPHMWLYITGRSSTLRKHGLFVPPAIIDSGYRGELYAGVWNLTDEPKLVAEGERLAQFIPMNLHAAHTIITNSSAINMGDRGTRGFGSTGR